MAIKKDKEKESPKQAKKNVQSVQNAIPYEYVYENGVIETKPGVFTKMYKLEDVNFKIAPDREQVDIFNAFGQFLNSFSPAVKFQIIIQNHNSDRYTTLNSVKIPSQKDNLNKFRNEMNSILIDKLAESKNNLSQEKYLVISIEDVDVGHAMQVLSSIDIDIEKALQKITKDRSSGW